MGVDESARRYGQVFDDVAEAYDEVRSGYPDDLIDSALEIGGLAEGSHVVEVGCGTGKLTEALVGRGLRVEAVDPGARMVSMARRRVGESDAVCFHISTFEDVVLSEDTFDAVFSATAFHWIDPRVGWRKAASLLKREGLLALLSHVGVVDDRTSESEAALRDVLGAHAPEILATFKEPRSAQALLEGGEERAANVSDVWTWVGHHDLSVPEAATLFEGVEVRGVPSFRELTADDFLALCRTTSLWARLAPDVRDALEAENRRVIEKFGGTIGAEVRRDHRLKRTGGTGDGAPTCVAKSGSHRCDEAPNPYQRARSCLLLSRQDHGQTIGRLAQLVRAPALHAAAERAYQTLFRMVEPYLDYWVLGR